MTPANSTLASHALRWDARPRIAVADSRQWFPPAHHETHLAPEPARQLPLLPTRSGRLPGDRPAWRSNENPRRKRTLRLRRNRELVP